MSSLADSEWPGNFVNYWMNKQRIKSFHTKMLYVNIIYLNSYGCCLMGVSVPSSSPRNWLAEELRGLPRRTLCMTFWLSVRLFESPELLYWPIDKLCCNEAPPKRPFLKFYMKTPTKINKNLTQK